MLKLNKTIFNSPGRKAGDRSAKCAFSKSIPGLPAWVVVFVFCLCLRASAEPVGIVVGGPDNARAHYGVERLVAALSNIGMQPQVGVDPAIPLQIVIDQKSNPDLPAESYTIRSNGKVVLIRGVDASGELYGCLDLTRRIVADRKLPADLNISESPAMKLRGPCIGMQKTYILPGRHIYEYPYTPELFPFFYDKAFWTKYLDFLADNRFNTLYLWNGHPFASLVKLSGYPYALEVDEATFARNQEMFRWLTAECDKRGIWLVQMFYNILLSKPFAEHNNLATQLKDPNPIAADYTRKSIAEFVKQYPHVGLMVCLGEALQGQDNQNDWFINVILPGVKDGMKEAGLKEEPPVVVRTHATNLRITMPMALKVYKNLYTEAKYTGESLTTGEPRGKWQGIHQDMSKLGSTHIMNVHVLSNLEPFRYGDQRFIQQCIEAGIDRLGARGLHLYPLCYWNWPESADATNPPLQQIDRDWIWFEAWGRYAWNPKIDEKVDHEYWVNRVADHYGKDAAENILSAYNDSGECAPRLIRRFGITEGNRQTLSLGMTLDQLVRPEKYNQLPDLWESDAPPGERLDVFVDKEWKHEPHEGETPVSINQEVLDYSAKAVAAIDAAASQVTSNKDEFERVRNDVKCIRAMSQNYVAKVNAAICVLRYNHSQSIADMEQAEKYLSESLDHYRELVALTDKTYNFANSMQTSQRKIPVPGGSGGKPANYHWRQVLPTYEKELADFQTRVANLKSGKVTNDDSGVKPLPKAKVQVADGGETFKIAPGATVLDGQDAKIVEAAPELVGQTGIRVTDGASADIETAEPVQVLIGYFRSDDAKYAKPPQSETDAMAAERGSTEPVIRNAVVISGLPPVDVFTQYYPAGKSKIEVRNPGTYVILGVVPQSFNIPKRDAGKWAK